MITGKATQLISAFGALVGPKGQSTDGGFPMAFESEHVPQIIQCFAKLHSIAAQRQTQLNQLWQNSQMQ